MSLDNCAQRRPLLHHTEVPPRVTENFILSGYRFPDCSLRDCLLSAFRPTNETGNFWSHFLPVLVFAYYFAEPFGLEGAPPRSDPFFYPLWNYFIGVLCLLLASSLAHLLNSMSLVIREVCFFVDYGTISAYTVGSSLAYYYYIHPRAGLLEEEGGGATLNATSEVDQEPSWSLWSALPESSVFFEVLYIPSSCAVAIVCVLACCNTRQRWRTYRYVIRTLVFLLPFLVASAPIFLRLRSASPYPARSAARASSASMGVYFARHCAWLVVSAVFNISKVPERLAPGWFDIVGHSHQWFHICTFLSILDELHLINGEVRAILLSLPPASAPRLPGPTLLSTYGVMLLLQASIAVIIARFSTVANAIYGPQRDQLAREQHLKMLDAKKSH